MNRRLHYQPKSIFCLYTVLSNLFIFNINIYIKDNLYAFINFLVIFRLIFDSFVKFDDVNSSFSLTILSNLTNNFEYGFDSSVQPHIIYQIKSIMKIFYVMDKK